MALKLTPSNLGLTHSSSWNLFLKNKHVSSFTLLGSSIQTPFTNTPLKVLDLRFEFTTLWKNLELQSPSLIHLALAFCLNRDSCDCAAAHCSSWSFFLTRNSWLDNCLSSPSDSSLFSSFSMVASFWWVSPKCSLFQIFSLALTAFIFSLSTKPPHPLTVLFSQDSWTTLWNDLSWNKQFKILKGRSPQSTTSEII